MIDLDSSDAPTGTDMLQRRMPKGGVRGMVRPRPKARAPPRRARWSIDALLSNQYAVMVVGLTLIVIMARCVYALSKYLYA